MGEIIRDFSMMGATYNQLEANGQRSDELRHFIFLLNRRRWLIGGVIVLSTVMAGVLSFMVTPVYVASTTLVPAESGDARAAIGSALGQFGGLAELAGLQGPQNQTVIEAIALLKSREFTADFIRDKNLLPVLFGDRWDATQRRWKPGKAAPDLWDGYRRFDRTIRFVDQDEKTGIVTLRIEWKDPGQAAIWANELVARVNAQMQRRALTETGVTLKYLKQELAETRVASVQIALQDLVEANLKRQAIASVRSEYVFRVVDPAAPPNLRDKLRPHKAIYLITGLFFGIILSLLATVTFDAAQNVRSWLRAGGSSE